MAPNFIGLFSLISLLTFLEGQDCLFHRLFSTFVIHLLLEHSEAKGNLQFLLLLDLDFESLILLPNLFVSFELLEFRRDFFLQYLVVFLNFQVLFLDALQTRLLFFIVK